MLMSRRKSDEIKKIIAKLLNINTMEELNEYKAELRINRNSKLKKSSEVEKIINKLLNINTIEEFKKCKTEIVKKSQKNGMPIIKLSDVRTMEELTRYKAKKSKDSKRSVKDASSRLKNGIATYRSERKAKD